MNFKDIKPFTPLSGYMVNLGWDTLRDNLDRYVDEYNLQLNPDFQRGHVWNRDQQIAYVEYALRGGCSGRDIYTNCPNWHKGAVKDFVLVDGLQRLTAASAYLNNEIPAFGHYYREMEGKLRGLLIRFNFHVNSLPTRAEVLRWYLELNTGGVVHSKEELDRVKGLLEKEG